MGNQTYGCVISQGSSAYAIPFQGVSAYAQPLEPAPWDPPSIFEPPRPPCVPVVIQSPLPEDTADSLLDRCKRRLAEIERLLAQQKDLEVEAETLRKMIKATEKG